MGSTPIPPPAQVDHTLNKYSSRKYAALTSSWRTGCVWARADLSLDRPPQDIVQLVIIVQIGLAEIHPGRSRGGRDFAGLRSSSDMRGFSA